MKRAAILLAALALSGCATTRFVKSPCLSRGEFEELKQAEPEKVGPKLTGRADEDVKILGGSAVRLRGWGHGLLNVLGGCAG
jgi:hypothetical protein